MLGFPSSRTRATTVTNTPNAATVAMVAALDLRNGLALSGRLGGIRAGMKGSALNSFRGDLGALQTFKGWSGPPVGLMPGAAMHLPMTSVPDTNTGAFKATQ